MLLGFVMLGIQGDPEKCREVVHLHTLGIQLLYYIFYFLVISARIRFAYFAVNGNVRIVLRTLRALLMQFSDNWLAFSLFELIAMRAA